MIKDDSLKCMQCGKMYANMSNLNRHLRRCVLNITYKCEYCDLELTERDNLKRHLLTCRKYEYFLIYNEEKNKYLEKHNEKKKLYEEEIGILKLENLTNSGIWDEREVTITTANAWQELTFDYTAISTTNQYQKLVFIFDLGTQGDASPNYTFYFDSIVLTN